MMIIKSNIISFKHHNQGITSWAMIKSGDNIIIEMLKQPNIKQISGH